MTTIGSLFSGIGGLELGLELCGLGPVVWQCDSDPWARAVLAHHWPGVTCYEDVGAMHGATRVHLVCGGFPCQPHSVAGKRQGKEDARWLWPEFRWVLARVRPALVFIENVPGLRSSGLRDVLADLAALGFDATWDCFSAAQVGAPHRRLRLFVLAYADRTALGKQPGRSGGARGAREDVARLDGVNQHVAHGHDLADADGKGQPRASAPGIARGDRVGDGDWWTTEPDVGRVAHGVPARAHRLRLLGNAVVPQQAAHAFRTLSARALEACA